MSMSRDPMGSIVTRIPALRLVKFPRFLWYSFYKILVQNLAGGVAWYLNQVIREMCGLNNEECNEM